MERFAHHKGPRASERIMSVRAGAVPIETTVPPGGRLLDAMAGLLETYGVESAALTLSSGEFGPFAYVIPGLSQDGSQVASYSKTFRPPGTTRLEVAAITVGFRGEKPFFHCHGLWTEADGRRGCGHVLPDETGLAGPITVKGAGIVGARFVVTPDPETGFNLFMPHPTGTCPPPTARPAIALRLAPNQDLLTTLEQAGQVAGFRRAIVQGGVASTNEARFVEAPAITGFATELLVRHGTIRCVPEAGEPSILDIAIVDYNGMIGGGYFASGVNPVLMTFEGVLEAVP